MFGYIKPAIPELRVKEYELYRAVYCGLCESLGHNATCVSRLSLSYDFVFLAIVRMALTGESGKIERHRCLAHPTKKRAVLVGARQLDYTAKLSAVMTYHKLRDDIADNRGAKRLAPRLLMPFAALMRRRAKLDKPTGDFIAEKLSELSKLEKEGCESLDKAAEPFGELMAYVCSRGLDENSPAARIACEMGRHIGRYIYALDAIDDLADDIKTGAYNPLSMIYENEAEGLCADIETLRCALTMELVGIEAAVKLIDFTKAPEYGEIIKNIIYLGLPVSIDKVLGKYKHNTACGDQKNGEE